MHRGFCILVSFTALLAFLPRPAHLVAEDSSESAEKLLQAAGIPVDDAGLLQFLRSRVKEMESGTGPELPVAAARLLGQRRLPGTAALLLELAPSFTDAWAEEELLAVLGELAARSGKVDPAVVNVLRNGPAQQRAVAAYVLACRGGMEQRDAIRDLFADSEPAVRQRAVEGLLGKRTVQAVHDTAVTDEILVRGQNLQIEEGALLEFFRRRTLSEADQEHMRRLVRQFGDPVFKQRETASRQLTDLGTPALPYLKVAEQDGDLEIARRAHLCSEEIRRGPGPALPIAAMRLLTRRIQQEGHSAGAAIRVLLAYAPFADDDTVQEELLNALCLLSAGATKVDPLLPATLADPSPTRRAAAAFVLGRVGTRADCELVRKVLGDSSPQVRLRAVQGLLAARDPAAVPRLIGLLADAEPGSLWQVEELLHRLAGDRAPSEPVGDGGLDARQRALRAWNSWWRGQDPSFDLARFHDDDVRLGLMTICEHEAAPGQPGGGQVWECGRDGKARWRISNLKGVMDAQVLSSGRVLITENSGQVVTERDLAGNIKWQYRLEGNPVTAQRLANGNTFIATYNQVLEVMPGGKLLYNHNRGPGFYIFSAQKLRNGNVLCITADARVIEFEASTGKEMHSVHVGQAGGWCSVEGLPNGRYLVATMGDGQVRELDTAGKIHWKCDFPGAFRATRLPNGNTLVCSMTTKKVAEFDRAGTLRWDQTCQGRPWSVRCR